MTALQITWIRHGSTSWNKEGRAQGHSDIPLDEEGIRQAVSVAERLSQETWDAVYSSDLSRAKQTAEIIAERLGIRQVIFDRRLRELSGGLIEGTTLEERIQRWGPQWRELDLGAEKPEEGAVRGCEFIKDVENKVRQGRVLIISHGAIIRTTLKGLMPDLNVEQPLHNTSVTRIRKTDGIWTCELYNCTQHLCT